MTRSLIQLSAAIAVAAGLAAHAVAGPTDGAALRHGPAPLSPEFDQAAVDLKLASITPSELFASGLGLGFASDGVRRPALVPLLEARSGLLTGESDVADRFVTSDWTASPGTMNDFSRPVIDDVSSLLVVTDPAIPSPEVASLSVPEVPLPLNVIPAFVGIATVLVIHHRSLRSGKTHK